MVAARGGTAVFEHSRILSLAKRARRWPTFSGSDCIFRTWRCTLGLFIRSSISRRLPIRKNGDYHRLEYARQGLMIPELMVRETHAAAPTWTTNTCQKHSIAVIKPYHSDTKVGTSVVVCFGRCHEATMLSPIYHTPLLHPQLCQTLLARINIIQS